MQLIYVSSENFSCLSSLHAIAHRSSNFLIIFAIIWQIYVKCRHFRRPRNFFIQAIELLCSNSGSLLDFYGFICLVAGQRSSNIVPKSVGYYFLLSFSPLCHSFSNTDFDHHSCIAINYWHALS